MTPALEMDKEEQRVKVSLSYRAMPVSLAYMYEKLPQKALALPHCPEQYIPLSP